MADAAHHAHASTHIALCSDSCDGLSSADLPVPEPIDRPIESYVAACRSLAQPPQRSLISCPSSRAPPSSSSLVAHHAIHQSK